MFNLIRMLPLHLTSLKSDKRGVTAIEYALIAGLVAVVLIGGATTLGTDLSTAFTNIGSSVTSATTAAAVTPPV